MRSNLCEASAAPPAPVGPVAPVAPVANVEREARSVVATELPINVRRFMRGIVLLQPQKGTQNGGPTSDSGVYRGASPYPPGYRQSGNLTGKTRVLNSVGKSWYEGWIMPGT